jgi:transcriptional regulator with XRE-family HTH domain
MSKEEIIDLLSEMKRKNIRAKQLAQQIGCSESLLSQFFNFRTNLSQDKQIKLKQIVKQTREYEWRKVYLDQ